MNIVGEAVVDIELSIGVPHNCIEIDIYSDIIVTISLGPRVHTQILSGYTNSNDNTQPKSIRIATLTTISV
jgi:hypothetical protein